MIVMSSISPIKLNVTLVEETIYIEFSIYTQLPLIIPKNKAIKIFNEKGMIVFSFVDK